MTATRVPTLIGALRDWTDVSVSTFAACATRASGAFSCWGRNDEGQLGLGDTTARAEPAMIAAPSTATALGAGRFHTCVLDGARRALCSGENNRGQLAVGDTARRSSFTAVLR
jgi:alpha-tubulin suppressor-like RCC1 family protein